MSMRIVEFKKTSFLGSVEVEHHSEKTKNKRFKHNNI